MTRASRLNFLNLEFDRLTIGEAARAIVAKADKRDPFAYVVMLNLDDLARLEMRPELRALYRSAWLTLSDSRILELLARATGIDLPAAPGSDILETLLRTYVRAGDPVTVIGGSEATIQALRSRFGLADIRWLNAPAGLRDDAAACASCVEFILANPSPFIVLAVGSPQQEMIAAACAARKTAIGVALCCGASLDWVSGEPMRAPHGMGAANFDWLHPAKTNFIRLWRRYFIDGPHILRIWMKWRAAPQA